MSSTSGDRKSEIGIWKMVSEPKNLSDGQPVSSSTLAAGRKFWKEVQAGKIDLAGIRRIACGPGGKSTRFQFKSKAWRAARERALRAAAKRRDKKRKALARELWLNDPRRRRGRNHTTRCPALGSTMFDKLTLWAMTPFDWQSAAQIAERVDWKQLDRQPAWMRVPHKRTDVLRRLELEDRFMRQGIVEREGTPRGRVGDVFHLGSLVYRLTNAGRELRKRLGRGEVVLPRPHNMKLAFPVGWVPSHRKIVCALAPGAWRSAREIYEVAMPGCTKQEGENLVNNYTRKLIPAGYIERKEHSLRVLKGVHWKEFRRRIATPRWLYRLTERGVALREVLMLID